MRYAIHLPNFGDYGDPRLLAELAGEAEDHGWDGFFIWDHIIAPGAMPVADTTVTLAAIALETHRIQFGPLVIPLLRRSPWKVAREAVTLDHLSDGRLILGIGSGGDWFAELTTFGLPVNDVLRAEQLDEGLAILTGLMSGEEVAHKGKHTTLSSRRASFLRRCRSAFHSNLDCSNLAKTASISARSEVRWRGAGIT